MAHRRHKRRTHAEAHRNGRQGSASLAPKLPKSMVIRVGAGKVGSSVSHLVNDVRATLEPETARRLKVLPRGSSACPAFFFLFLLEN